jgi:cytochrome c553
MEWRVKASRVQKFRFGAPTVLRHKPGCGMFWTGSGASVASGDCGHSNNGSVNMTSKHFPTIFGTLVILAALATPAGAAEGIEAKLQVCSSCHGENGQPIDATIPIIWGQTEYFIVKQLHDYKS